VNNTSTWSGHDTPLFGGKRLKFDLNKDVSLRNSVIFPQSLQANLQSYLILGYYRFLPKSLYTNHVILVHLRQVSKGQILEMMMMIMVMWIMIQIILTFDVL
jgi:hypothetical protein